MRPTLQLFPGCAWRVYTRFTRVTMEYACARSSAGPISFPEAAFLLVSTKESRRVADAGLNARGLWERDCSRAGRGATRYPPRIHSYHELSKSIEFTKIMNLSTVVITAGLVDQRLLVLVHQLQSTPMGNSR